MKKIAIICLLGLAVSLSGLNITQLQAQEFSECTIFKAKELQICWGVVSMSGSSEVREATIQFRGFEGRPAVTGSFQVIDKNELANGFYIYHSYYQGSVTNPTGYYLIAREIEGRGTNDQVYYHYIIMGKLRE